MDFKRNQILVNDSPGGAGPRPIFKYGTARSAIIKYLRECGIEYIVHYKDPIGQSGWTEDEIREKCKKMSIMIRSGNDNGFLFINAMKQVIDKHETIYDDGVVVVSKL